LPSEWYSLINGMTCWQWRNAMRAFGAQAPPVFLKKENSILFNE